MNQRIVDRTMIAQFVIVGSVCIGGWFWLIEPRARLADELEAKIHDAHAAESIDQSQLESLGDRARSIREQVKAIERANALGSDSSGLYALLMDLAEDHNVQVQRLNPGAEQAESDGVRSRTFEVYADGGLIPLSEYLGALDALEGFLRVTVLQLAPRGQGDERHLTARIVCEAISVPIDGDLAFLGDGGDA